jgi:Family of unknown function (DUF5681)
MLAGSSWSQVMNDDENDAVGYGRPPLHSRFKPGQSGNRKGRPKESVSFASELAEELAEVIADPHGGGLCTKRRAIAKGLIAKAITGDAKAAIAVISLSAKLPESAAEDPRAAHDEAFVQKLNEREQNVAEEGQAIATSEPESD